MASSAKATSGKAGFAIDGKNDRYYYSVWESDSLLPQHIIIDLGEIITDISYLEYVPKYVPLIIPTCDGSIKEFELYSSIDGFLFDKIVEGEWNGDENIKVI